VPRRLRVLAAAKVNLTLEVLGRRDDGYHEIASVMTTIGLADDVRVGPARALDVRVRPPLEGPPGEELVGRAARALAEAAGIEPRAHVLVRKRIPVAAGLGGGSSDAGAALRALARTWHADGADLVAIGARVGSDVPFFAAGHPLARVAGRGESVRALPVAAEPLWIVLVLVAARSLTAHVFAALTPAEMGDGRATDDLVSLLERGGATPALVRELARNDLAAAAERVCPPIGEAREAAAGQGATLQLSGSGPSLFAIADDRAQALHLARSLRRRGLRARAYPTCVPAPVVSA